MSVTSRQCWNDYESISFSLSWKSASSTLLRSSSGLHLPNPHRPKLIVPDLKHRHLEPARAVQIQPQPLQDIHDDAVRKVAGLERESGDAEEATL